MQHRCSFGIFALLTLTATGCSTCSSDDNGTAVPAISAEASSKLAPGDRVVVEYARAAFIEGAISIVGPDSLTIVEQGVGASREVDAANVYRLNDRAEKDWSDGDLAICQMTNHRWFACRVKASTSERIAVVDEKGREASLPPDSVLEPTAVTELNLKHVFERVESAKSFARGVREAGTPFRPAAWEPRKGEGVIVREGGVYVSAVVQQHRKSFVLVQVTGADDKPRAVSQEDIWPQPPVDASSHSGAYACVRPLPGEHVWRIVRVHHNKGEDVVVDTADGRQRTVESRDLLPFVSAKPVADQ